MTNGNAYAFRFPREVEITSAQMEYGHEPLSKREYFAGLAMQGLASISGYATHNPTNVQEGCKNIAERSVMFADALIAELNQP